MARTSKKTVPTRTPGTLDPHVKESDGNPVRMEPLYFFDLCVLEAFIKKYMKNTLIETRICNFHRFLGAKYLKKLLLVSVAIAGATGNRNHDGTNSAAMSLNKKSSPL